MWLHARDGGVAGRARARCGCVRRTGATPPEGGVYGTKARAGRARAPDAVITRGREREVEAGRDIHFTQNNGSGLEYWASVTCVHHATAGVMLVSEIRTWVTVWPRLANAKQGRVLHPAVLVMCRRQ
jgi:hypothetical protein